MNRLKRRTAVNKGMADRITRYHDDSMCHEKLDEHFGFSGFFNHGYWDEHTQDQKAECENMAQLCLRILR
jgi:hypothetical protein